MIGVVIDQLPAQNTYGGETLYRIVLIDDEPWSAAVLKESIDWKELGFYIDRLYTNPMEALRAICADPPDVVITDISMPVLDGLELIRKAQFDGCTSRFVILSAHRNFDYAKAALRLDVVDYYLKPIHPGEITTLFSSIKATLDEEHNLSPGETLPAGRFEEILAYIDANLHQHLTLQSISDTFFLNRTYICALFKKHLDVTFSQYLTSARLEKAKFYLSHTNLKQLEIAEKVGFKDEFYFSKVFKKAENMSPGVYRKLAASRWEKPGS
ncbi:response regulator [Neglecta sp. X4]|nr:response regulator [Neglectibacter sp. 59]NBJ73319.1 response regulator [Neglectibacter sp. X4]NCE81229.1 response regulator [Neglectibacter sp. X58]